MPHETAPHDHRSRDKNLTKAYASIEHVANRLDIDGSDVKLAESIYEQYIDHREYPVDDIEDTALAALYMAGKFTGKPIVPEDITENDAVSSDRKHLLRRSTDITSELSLAMADIHDIPPFVDRICDALETDDSIRSRAKEIVTIAEDGNVTSGKKPTAIAAAAIYNASLDTGNGITQCEIATAADVTEPTIRSRYQEQRQLLDNDL